MLYRRPSCAYGTPRVHVLTLIPVRNVVAILLECKIKYKMERSFQKNAESMLHFLNDYKYSDHMLASLRGG